MNLKSIEYNILGLAIASYFIISVFVPFTPFDSKRTILASIIALFFPYLSKQKKLVLCGIGPAISLMNYPQLFIFMMPLLENLYIFDFWLNKGDSIAMTWVSPEILLHFRMITLIIVRFFEPFLFCRIYKKIGLYDKMPFMQSSIATET